jgi:hypothetical protein
MSKRNGGKYENTRDQAGYSDFNIEMMNVFTAPFFFAPVVRYYPLSFSHPYAARFHSNPSDKRMLSQRTTGRDFIEMERPPERNGKTQMISGIQDISLGQKHR